MMRKGLLSSRRIFTASELAILSHATGAWRRPHPNASAIALTSSSLRIQSLLQLSRLASSDGAPWASQSRNAPPPGSQGQPPLLEDRQCHCAHAALCRSRGCALLEQPRLELIGVGVGGDGAVEQVTLYGESDHIGCRVPFATLPAAFRGFEGAEQLTTDVARAGQCVQKPLRATILTSKPKPGRSGRWYPRSRAATSKATVATSSNRTPHQGSSLTVGSALTYPLQVSHTSTLRVVSPSSGARYPRFS